MKLNFSTINTGAKIPKPIGEGLPEIPANRVSLWKITSNLILNDIVNDEVNVTESVKQELLISGLYDKHHENNRYISLWIYPRISIVVSAILDDLENHSDDSLYL
jgi:hypothetical protein